MRRKSHDDREVPYHPKVDSSVSSQQEPQNLLSLFDESRVNHFIRLHSPTKGSHY